jgi:hypothetical protein
MDKKDFNNLLTEQNNSCAICNVEFTDYIKPYTDQDSDTGMIRGLLCSPCFLGLSCFRHKPEMIKKAVSYLENRYGPECLRF